MCQGNCLFFSINEEEEEKEEKEVEEEKEKEEEEEDIANTMQSSQQCS